MKAALLALAMLLAVGPAAAQTVDMDWYMTSQASSRPGAELLSMTAPAGAGQTHAFSPALAGTGPTPPNTYLWASDLPFDATYTIVGGTEVSLFFDLGVDVQATTTAVLSSVASDGTVTELARNSQQGVMESAAHSETLVLPTDGMTVAEGTTLLLSISVTDLAVLVQLDYGGSATASGITGFVLQPAQAPANPGGPIQNPPTSGADASPEVWVASILLTLSIAAAGAGRLWRFS